MKQTVVGRSNAEVEFWAKPQGICEVLWIKKPHKEFKLERKEQMKIYCDNKVAIGIACDVVKHDHNKHVEEDMHFSK